MKNFLTLVFVILLLSFNNMTVMANSPSTEASDNVLSGLACISDWCDPYLANIPCSIYSGIDAKRKHLDDLFHDKQNHFIYFIIDKNGAIQSIEIDNGKTANISVDSLYRWNFPIVKLMSIPVGSIWLYYRLDLDNPDNKHFKWIAQTAQFKGGDAALLQSFNKIDVKKKDLKDGFRYLVCINKREIDEIICLKAPRKELDDAIRAHLKDLLFIPARFYGYLNHCWLVVESTGDIKKPFSIKRGH